MNYPQATGPTATLAPPLCPTCTAELAKSTSFMRRCASVWNIMQGPPRWEDGTTHLHNGFCQKKLRINRCFGPCVEV